CYKRGGVTCPCYAVTGDHRFYHAVMGAHRCQAVTPSDLATALMALDADVVIAGDGARRELPMGRFFTGPGETALRRGEILAEVRVPAAARRRVGRFEKLRLWEGDFAVASVAASLDLGQDGSVRDARVVLGAAAPTPFRAREVERALMGRRLDAETIGLAAESWTEGAHPLAGNEWKIDATVGLTERCLARCGDSRGATGGVA
ncbi:MAG: FAD binding domain-containing protein, partial [Actinomycetota bacterium]